MVYRIRKNTDLETETGYQLTDADKGQFSIKKGKNGTSKIIRIGILNAFPLIALVLRTCPAVGCSLRVLFSDNDQFKRTSSRIEWRKRVVMKILCGFAKAFERIRSQFTIRRMLTTSLLIWQSYSLGKNGLLT